jgi:hypothetical protein
VRASYVAYEGNEALMLIESPKYKLKVYGAYTIDNAE